MSAPVPSEPTESAIRAAAAELAGAEPAALAIRRCATGKYNSTWFVDGAARPLVLRVAPPDDPALHLFYEYRMMRREPALHALLRARTDVPVPEVLAHAALHPGLGRDCLLMERLPGTPLSDHGGLDARAIAGIYREVGHCLRQVHEITGEGYGYPGPGAPMALQKDWPSAFALMWHRLLDDIERCGGYAKDEAGAMRALYERHRAVFDRDVAPALLHMDVWAQNILAGGDGRMTGLLDWDRGLFGDPEIEFAVLDYCGVSVPAFWEGYGAARDTSPVARVRGVFYLLYELQKYIFIRRVRGGSVADAEPYRRQAFALASKLA